MEWTVFLWAIYIGIALFALGMTMREQVMSGQRSVAYGLIGYVACALWPLAVAAVIVEVRRRGA